MLDVMLVGTGGMTPLPRRFLSSALLRFKGTLILIDCGEGTQVSMRMSPRPIQTGHADRSRTGELTPYSLPSLKMAGWGFKEISSIFLTHLHGDHVVGLPGLLLSVGNSGREEPLTVHGPGDLLRLADAVETIAPHLPFPVRWRPLSGGDLITVEGMAVSTLRVRHGVPCLAYAFQVPRGRRFDPERAQGLGLPVQMWGRLQSGESVKWEGRQVEPDEVLGEERRGLKLSYVTDTRPTPELPGFVAESDLLICEGMYGSTDDLPKAMENGHMLFSEAAQIAREGRVRELWLTHYSPSLSEPEEWLGEASRIFPNVRAGHDRMSATLRFRE
jgi:ribonuclease Z